MIPEDVSCEVSIVIVNYNNSDLVENCVESIVNFTKGVNYEIIVVDNNSTRGDIKKSLLRFPDVILIQNKTNIGFAGGNNKGYEMAKGKYILFLNNDTVLLENTIKIIYDYAESLSYKVFIGCKLKNTDGTHQGSLIQFDNILNYIGEKLFLYLIFPRSRIFNRFYQNYIDVQSPIEVDVIKGPFMFCDAESIKELRGFDSRFFFYSEEVDLCFRFKLKKGKIIYYPMTSIIHFGGVNVNRTRWFDFKNQVIGRIQILQKHYHGLNFFCMLSLHYLGIFLRVWVYCFQGIIKMDSAKFTKSFYYIKQLFIYPQNQFKMDNNIDYKEFVKNGND